MRPEKFGRAARAPRAHTGASALRYLLAAPHAGVMGGEKKASTRRGVGGARGGQGARRAARPWLSLGLRRPGSLAHIPGLCSWAD